MHFILEVNVIRMMKIMMKTETILRSLFYEFKSYVL